MNDDAPHGDSITDPKSKRSDREDKKEKKSKKHHHRHGSDKHRKEKKGTKEEDAALAPTGANSSSNNAHENNNSNSVEDWEANRQRVEQLTSAPPNNICVDCGENGTRWASVNLGVFMCIRCSGIHRSLGVHISKVKSTGMDKWSSAEVDLMEAIGNRRAKDLYACHVPAGTTVPHASSSDDELRRFCEQKYGAKTYAAEDLDKTLKKIYKRVGYGAYAKKKKTSSENVAEQPKGGSDGEGAAAAAAMSKAARDETIRALYGNKPEPTSSNKGATAAGAGGGGGKIHKPIHGVFGVVNVSAELYDGKLAAVLKAFGEEPTVPAAAAAV